MGNQKINGNLIVTGNIGDGTSSFSPSKIVQEYELSLTDNVIEFVTTNNISRKVVVLKDNYGRKYIGQIEDQHDTYYSFNLRNLKNNDTYYANSADLAGKTFNDIFSNTYKKTFELTENKVTSISANSSDAEYPSAKAVYNAPKMIEVTWKELKNLRDNSQLIPGMQYRIIDYETIIRDNGAWEPQVRRFHEFDIIVTADSKNILNETAKACISKRDDGYFGKVVSNYIKSAEWINANIQPEDIEILYNVTKGEEEYPTHESAKIITQVTYLPNHYGVLVPAMLNPDPHSSGRDCYYIYDGTFTISHYQNTLVTTLYSLNSKDEEIYEPGEYNPEDLFVEIDYEEIDGVQTPVMFKNEFPKYAEATPDYNDKFVYIGDFILDGVNYNRWRKMENNNYSGYEILTQVVVVNNQFTITQEQLTAAIEETSTTYDKWEEYENNVFKEYYHLTEQLVVSEIVEEQTVEYSKLTAWQLRYCLDNDYTRFAWAEDREWVEVKTLEGKYNWLAKYPQGDVQGRYAWAFVQGSSSPISWDTVRNIEPDTSYLFYSNYPHHQSQIKFYDSVNSSTVWAQDVLRSHYPGKGVIYRMVDEFNNDIPYDFKNIQFYWSSINKWCYVFTILDNNEATDASRFIEQKCHDNIIQSYRLGNANKQQLNKILFYESGNTWPIACYSNFLGVGCDNIRFRNETYYNSFKGWSASCVFLSACVGNTFGSYVRYFTANADLYYSTIGTSLQYITINTMLLHSYIGNDNESIIINGTGSGSWLKNLHIHEAVHQGQNVITISEEKDLSKNIDYYPIGSEEKYI